MSKINLNTLSAADLEALLAQAAEVKKARKDTHKSAYGQQLVDFVTSVVEKEEYTQSEKSDWAGYSVRQIPVSIEGHAFTVSVTITDPSAKEKRAQERKVAEARALLASVETE